MIKKWKSLDGFEKSVVVAIVVTAAVSVVLVLGLINQSNNSVAAGKFCILRGYDKAQVGMFSGNIDCVKTFTWEEWHDAE